MADKRAAIDIEKLVDSLATLGGRGMSFGADGGGGAANCGPKSTVHMALIANGTHC